MPSSSDITWFRTTFGAQIAAAPNLKPFDADFLVAIACQETGEVWPILRHKNLTVDRILELCVGDTLDGRASRKKAALVALPEGQAMFDKAHALLVDMAHYIPGYSGAAVRDTKFCHGFGVFQYDIQFFRKDPDYFLRGGYAKFSSCLGHCLGELHTGLVRLGYQSKPTLTDRQMVNVAIAYNTGHYDPAKGLKQGYRNPSDGLYYGENIAAILAKVRATR